MSDQLREPDSYETYLAAIRRSNAETEKFIAEQRKLIAESEKLAAEQRKLMAENDKLFAEAAKFNRERTIGVTAAAVTALVALGALIAKFLGH